MATPVAAPAVALRSEPSGGGTVDVTTSGAITAEMQGTIRRLKLYPMTILLRAMSSACWRR